MSRTRGRRILCAIISSRSKLSTAEFASLNISEKSSLQRIHVSSVFSASTAWIMPLTDASTDWNDMLSCSKRWNTINTTFKLNYAVSF